MNVNTSSKGLRLQRECIFELMPPFPRNLLIGLTNVCNHRCVFCANRKTERKTKIINPNLLTKLLCEAYDLGAREVGYSLTAEPFINKNLEFSVITAHEIGYEYIYTTTNGSLADTERMRVLFENGLNSVKYSLNAGNRDSYKKTHGRDDFDKVIENIISADKLRNELGIEVGLYLSFVGYSGNVGEFESLKQLLGSAVDKFYLYPMSNQAGKMTEDMKNGLAATSEKPVGFEKTSKCEMIFNRAHITAEGFLTGCCVDIENELVIADLNTTTLAEAWNCDNFQLLRKWHMENSIPQNCMCFNCVYSTSNPIIPLGNIVKGKL
jgi:organic radical activating enzyme